MVHKMQLATEYFEKIKNGTKTIECRLYDEKRKQLKIGDFIEFYNANNEQEKVETSILALHLFNTFTELLEHFPIKMFGALEKDAFLSVLKTFYSNEDEKKYGVVGIEIKLT